MSLAGNRGLPRPQTGSSRCPRLRGRSPRTVENCLSQRLLAAAARSEAADRAIQSDSLTPRPAHDKGNHGKDQNDHDGDSDRREVMEQPENQENSPHNDDQALALTAFGGRGQLSSQVHRVHRRTVAPTSPAHPVINCRTTTGRRWRAPHAESAYERPREWPWRVLPRHLLANCANKCYQNDWRIIPLVSRWCS